MATTAACSVPWAVDLNVKMQDARYDIAGLCSPSTAGLTEYRGGVMAAGDSGGSNAAPTGGKVIASSGLSVTVNAGDFQVPLSGKGPYRMTLQTTATLTHATADPTNPRLDLIQARVYDVDAGIGSSGQRFGQVEIVQGTPAGSPSLPAVSSGAIALAQVQVRAGSTTILSTDITDKRGNFLTARGGVKVINNTTPGSADMNEAGAYPGEMRYVQGSLFPLQVWAGSSRGWRGTGGGQIFNITPIATSGAVGGGTLTFKTVSIPDPGCPYYIKAAVALEGTSGKNCRHDTFITIDTTAGSVLNICAGVTPNDKTQNSNFQWWSVPYGTVIELTGGHSIVWFLKTIVANATFGCSTTTNGFCIYEIAPSP